MSVEIDIVYEGNLRCSATHGPSKQVITTDAPVDNGGKGEAFSPTDLVATAVGTCIVTIMGLLAQRSGLDIDGTRVHVAKEMVAAPHRRIGNLHVTVTMPAGAQLSEVARSKLERAAHLCPVKQSLHPDVNVVMDFVYPE
jgi:putative redox protein